MTSRPHEPSPQRYARIGGLLYLFIIAAAGFGELFVRDRLIVWGDAAATAQNILAAETLFRLGLAAELLTCACDVAMAMILYVLLRPVSRNLALLGALFRLTFVAFYGVTKLFEIAALVALKGTDALRALEPEQWHELALVSLRVHSLGYGASLLFFGFCCIVFGHLIARAGYLPRFLGLLLALAGYGYVVFSIAQLLAPAFAARFLFQWIFLLAFVAEAGLGLWLLVKGIDSPQWERRIQR